MILSHEQVKNLKGLSSPEVEANRKKYGYNELPSSKKKSVFTIIFDVFREPMFILLVSCGVIYLILGDIQEALMLLGFVFVIMGITIYQENKTENALDALKDLSSPRALVIRDGVQKRISGKEVVVGDVMILSEGDRVPADAELLWSMNLTADESLLTGESVPVRKIAAHDASVFPLRPGGDDLPFLYSGSLIVQGQAVARVNTVGILTEMGKIGKALQSIENEDTFLQKETGRIVRAVFFIAVVLCAIIVAVYGFSRGDWLQGILSGLTLAMAMLPEEFPVVLTVFLALGAWRMSKKHVLTRRVTAIETLGAATVLCSDKTGTLTQNRMRIQKLWNNHDFLDIHAGNDLPEAFHRLIEYGILASKKDPFDPMEKALQELGLQALAQTEHIHADWPFIEEYPLSRELLALSHVWKRMPDNTFVVSAKGAPEAITDLCHLPEERAALVAEKVNEMASEGLRVLGVAHAFYKRTELPKSQHDFDFEFMGLVGLSDPIRDTVPDAVQSCHAAGIRVIMITGDYPVTAVNIAKKIGLRNPEEIITGHEMEKMDPEELKNRVNSVNVFARVVPEQKLYLVKALKANGEIVGMTGDGVNDAPALKASHIGIAMGERGTDVARESSELVLLNDDFTSIVSAVRMGRRIYDNLKKAMAYIISVHIPIAGISLLPVLLGWPVILYPVHIVFLELVIDPACSIIFEAEEEEANIMTHPPRNAKLRLFSFRMLLVSVVQGIFSLVAVIFVYQVSLYLNHDEAESRTLTCITLVVSNLCLILTNRSWVDSIVTTLKRPNKALLWVASGAVIFLVLVVLVPFLRDIFHFFPINWMDMLLSMAAGVLSIAWFEMLKWLFRRNNIELLKQ